MKVIHDGDAAFEDIMALSLLLLNADLLAATVSYGESTPHIGASNVERVCRALKPAVNIPVAYGNNSPLDHHGTAFPDYIHREADLILEDTDIPPTSNSHVENSAVGLIYRTLMSSDEKITIVATGPLTNIAQLVQKHSDCLDKIEKLVIMGGAVNVPGNISDIIPDTTNTVAEWNVYADPKAADIIFSEAKLPILLVPIDITRQMPMTRAFYEGLDNESLTTLKFVKDMLTSILKGIGEDLFYGKLQFWDSLCAMIVLNNSMAEFEQYQLTVDLNTGQTKIANEQSGEIAQVQVACKLINPQEAYKTFVRLMKTGFEKDRQLNQVAIQSHYSGTLFAASVDATPVIEQSQQVTETMPLQ